MTVVWLRALILVALVWAAACGSAAQSGTPGGAGSGSVGTNATNGASDDIVAVIDGANVTRAELDGGLALALSEIEEQAYELRKDRLDALIAERLIAAEAKRRGISAEALEGQEVDAKVTPPTDAEVEAIFARYKDRAPGNPDALRAAIRTQLRAQKREARRRAYVSALEAAAAVERRLSPPPPRRASLDVGDAPIRGERSAAVTIVEFTDFHCPFCRRVQPTLLELLETYKGKVRLAFRHFPIDQLHPAARKASEAAWCAGQQGEFWAYHDELFTVGNDASPATLEKIAAGLGLDQAAFTSCLAGDGTRAAVERDLAEAQRLGLSGTPTFFINGRPLVGGLPFDAFAEIIDEELASAR